MPSRIISNYLKEAAAELKPLWVQPHISCLLKHSFQFSLYLVRWMKTEVHKSQPFSSSHAQRLIPQEDALK